MKPGWKYPVVEAVWLDHSFAAGDTTPEPHLMRSVGYLVKDTEEYLILSQTYNKTEKRPEDSLLILKATLQSVKSR